MRITYAITVANEIVEFKKLYETLRINKRDEDNIIVLVDTNKCPKYSEFFEFLTDLHKARHIKLIDDKFGGNFGEWKNKLRSHPLCKDYLFFLDADEIPNPILIENLPLIIELNPEVDVIGVPRANFVTGITPEYVKQMGWRQDIKERINYPDFQYRIMINRPGIEWGGQVHETIINYKVRTELPIGGEYDLLHIKSFEKQQKQNESYLTGNYNK